MKTKNIYWIIAGIINLFTAFLHLIGGQITLINPLLQSELTAQTKTELLGAWHIVSVILFASSIIYFKYGNGKKMVENLELISFTSYLYIGFSLVFIILNFSYFIFAPQWILLLPIGLFGILGARKINAPI